MASGSGAADRGLASPADGYRLMCDGVTDLQEATRRWQVGDVSVAGVEMAVEVEGHIVVSVCRKESCSRLEH